MAGHGAFFVNYVITAAFIGTALELIRFSELFMFALKLSLAHSSAEKTAVRKVLKFYFDRCFQKNYLRCATPLIFRLTFIKILQNPPPPKEFSSLTPLKTHHHQKEFSSLTPLIYRK